MTHAYMWYDVLHFDMCAMTHSYTCDMTYHRTGSWRISRFRLRASGSRLVPSWARLPPLWVGFICMIFLVYVCERNPVCEMGHSYVYMTHSQCRLLLMGETTPLWVTFRSVLLLVYMCDIARLYVYVWYCSFICVILLVVILLVYMCETSNMWKMSHICEMSHIFVRWVIYLWDESYICEMSHTFARWVIYLWDELYVWDVSLLRVHDLCTCLYFIQMFLFRSWLRPPSLRVAFISETWLIHMCDMTHSFVCTTHHISWSWVVIYRIFSMIHLYLCVSHGGDCRYCDVNVLWFESLVRSVSRRCCDVSLLSCHSPVMWVYCHASPLSVDSIVTWVCCDVRLLWCQSLAAVLTWVYLMWVSCDVSLSPLLWGECIVMRVSCHVYLVWCECIVISVFCDVSLSPLLWGGSLVMWVMWASSYVYLV